MSELYKLPDGWEWKKLENIFEIQRGGSPRPIKDFITDSEDGINWIKIGDTVKGEKYITQTAQKIKPEGLTKSRLVVEGDFIMSNSMSFGRPYIVKNKGAIHDGWLLMREKLENMNKDFFYYLLSSNYMYDKFSSKASGTTVKNLNINLVKSIEVPFPILSEQQRIVSKLDLLFEKIDKAIALHVKNTEEADAFMGSVLNDVFGELEEGYEKYALDTIADLIDGDRGKNYPKKTDFYEDGYCLFLNAKNVTKNGFKFLEKQFITKEKDELLDSVK
jgi:type I restriction enzyme S subunit